MHIIQQLSHVFRYNEQTFAAPARSPFMCMCLLCSLLIYTLIPSHGQGAFRVAKPLEQSNYARITRRVTLINVTRN